MQLRDLPGVNLFPLIKSGAYLDGYYMDAAFNIWSVRGKTPKKLAGTRNPSGHYYVLNKRTYRADDLRRAANHSDFAEETSGQVVKASTKLGAAVPVGRTSSAPDAITKKGYLLATLNPKGKLVFGTEPMFHLTDATAKAEAERIAAVTGGEVVMLKIVGKVKVQKAVWE